MKSSLVLVDVQDAVAHVRLNRPDKHNGITMEMIHAVLAAQRALARDRDVRAVILSGEGPSFCAGLDFKAVLGNPAVAAKGYAQLWLPTVNQFQRWSLGWRELGVPVIACVHGNCFGGGIQLALGADLRIATPDAKLSVMEAKWGLIPDMGGAVLLRELVRIDVAKELTMTARIFSGEQAHALGLVTHVAADPLAKARELAAELATRSPDAVAAAKRLIQESWADDDAGAASAERRRQRQLIGKANQRISVERNMKKAELPFRRRTVR